METLATICPPFSRASRCVDSLRSGRSPSQWHGRRGKSRRFSVWSDALWLAGDRDSSIAPGWTRRVATVSVWLDEAKTNPTRSPSIIPAIILPVNMPFLVPVSVPGRPGHESEAEPASPDWARRVGTGRWLRWRISSNLSPRYAWRAAGSSMISFGVPAVTIFPSAMM